MATTCRGGASSLMTIDWELAVHPGVSYSPVAVVSLIRRAIFLFWLGIRSGVVIVLGRFWQSRVFFNMLYFSPAVTTFQATVRRLTTGHFANPGYEMTWRWIINLVIRLNGIDQVLRHHCGTFFLFQSGTSSLPHKSRNWRLERVWGQQFLWQLVGGFIGIETFRYMSAQCIADDILTRVSFRSNITCSMMLQKTDWMPLFYFGATCVVYGPASLRSK